MQQSGFLALLVPQKVYGASLRAFWGSVSPPDYEGPPASTLPLNGG